MTISVVHYVTATGKDLYQAWLDRLKDRTAKLAIVRRVIRIELGDLGDHKLIGDGVSELRIDVGPGYRVYLAASGRRLSFSSLPGRRAPRSATSRRRRRIGRISNNAMTKAKAKAKVPPYVSHEEATVSMFREDPELAAEYLNSVLADGDRKELLRAMRYLSTAFGGVAGVAKATKLNARTLYRTLSEHGNPELDTFTALLKAMGMRITVAPIKSAKPTRSRVAQKAA